MKKERSLLLDKILFTCSICLFYVIGRLIPLYGVDVSALTDSVYDVQSFFIQTLSGDLKQASIFAVGISPYITAGIVVQLVSALSRSGKKNGLSPKKINIITVVLMLIIAYWQAGECMSSLGILESSDVQMLTSSGTAEKLVLGVEVKVPLVMTLREFLKLTVIMVQLMTGSVVMLVMSERNKKYGIGGQTIIIFVNIVDSIRAGISRTEPVKLIIPLCVGLLTMIVMIFMDNAEKRIHMQRISINNAYDEQSYIAIKFNPIGSMPIIISATLFYVPLNIIKGLLLVMPDSPALQRFAQNYSMTAPLGMIIYVILICLLNVFFALAMISPRTIAENMQKSGDSLEGIRPGRNTLRYLTASVVRLALISALIMSVCTVIPMLLQSLGYVDATAAMLPTSFMILAGIWRAPYEEISSIRTLESYKPFL